MDKQQHGTWVGIPEESTVMNGPDYVALVIEWDEEPGEPVEAIAETQVTSKTLATRLAHVPLRMLATAIAAVGAIGLAVWGIRRLRTA